MKQNRMETLKNNGVDTSKYFTLLVNENIPAGTKINIEINKVNTPVAQQIIEDGYVNNTKLHRRFVAAHYMRMLESPLGWHRYLNWHYDYMYQFDMMLEEVRVLSKLQDKDRETFNERSGFFTRPVVFKVLEDYLDDLRKYLKGLPVKCCRGKAYVCVNNYGNVFLDDLQCKVIGPIEAMITICKKTFTYKDLHEVLKMFKRIMVKLPYRTHKSKTWIDAFQKAGAYYTLKNLIMFHDVKLYFGGSIYDQHKSMQIIQSLIKNYEGYQFNALLKATIKANNFNFKKSIEAHK